MVESDTLHKKTSKKTEIRNGEALRTILGDEKIKFDTEYVYIGDKKIEENGSTTWYHYKSPKAKKACISLVLPEERAYVVCTNWRYFGSNQNF